MAAYSTETVHVKAGMFKDADDMVPKKLQPVLDKGTQAGKKLHSIQPIPDGKNKGMVFLVVWEA